MKMYKGLEKGILRKNQRGKAKSVHLRDLVNGCWWQIGVKAGLYLPLFSCAILSKFSTSLNC